MTSISSQNPCTPVKLPTKQQQHSPSQLNPSQNIAQPYSSEHLNSVQNSHRSESLPEPIDEQLFYGNNDQENDNQLLRHQQNQQRTPQVDDQNSKPQSIGQRQTQRKRRRKKLDADGRDYTCSCGKSYLSYPALYTHVKTKHNGQISITQNLRLPLAPSNPMTESRENLHSNKKQSPPIRQQPDQDHLSIDKIKEFIYRQFIKEREKEALVEFRKSLKLREEERGWINHVIKMAEYGLGVKVDDQRESVGQRIITGSGSKSDNLIVDSGCFNISNGGYREQGNEELGGGFNTSPETKKFERIHVIRTVMVEKNLKQNNKQINNSSRKGLISCIFPSVPQTCRKPSTKPEHKPIDQVLGTFLNQFFKGVTSNELINTAVVYFVCRIRDYCQREVKKINTSQKTPEILIEQSTELVTFLIEMQNSYLKQPVVVCKMLFFFYRWMYKQQFTNKFVRFNQAG